MATTAYQSAYTGMQIDDAIGAVQTAAFVGDDDGTGGVVDSSASLADLTDTNISSPTNGQALLYNTTTSKWVNGNVSGGGGDVNVIEIVKVNGSALTPDSNKAVNVSVPTALSALSDDSTHRTVTDTEKSTWNNKVSNVQADWSASSGLAQILNKPSFVTVYSGSTAPSSSTGSNGDIYIQTS